MQNMQKHAKKKEKKKEENKKKVSPDSQTFGPLCEIFCGLVYIGKNWQASEICEPQLPEKQFLPPK